MIKKLFFTLFIFIFLNSKSICNEFIGVIGVAVGDIKNQKNEGNAHERAYKYVAALPSIQRYLDIKYNPIVLVFTGDMSVSERYVIEFETIFDAWGETWNNNWLLEEEITDERLENIFPDA